MTRTRFVLSTAVLAVAAAGCADLSKYTKEGGDLVAQYLPVVEGLLGKNQAAQDAAAKLPTSLDGVKDVASGLASNQTALTDLKAQLTDLPGKLDSAAKAGKGDLVQKLLGDAKAAVPAGVTGSGDKLTGLTAQLTSLEAKAAALPPPAPVEATPAPFTKALPGGASISGNATGLESELIGFLESGKPVDKTTWFNFDRLTFKTGSAELDLEKSKEQLGAVAAILKAFPKVSLKVGGYSDNQGAAAANLKLSAARAAAVAKALSAQGVAAARLSPEGYGAAHPACPANDTDECRAKNRRIAVRVTAK
jgi:outer membrane protein OmpA-like peptidoglycan-associated protein